MGRVIRLLPRRLVRAWYCSLAVAFAAVILTGLTGQHTTAPAGITQDGAGVTSAVRSDYPPSKAVQRHQRARNRALFKCYGTHAHSMRWCVLHTR